MRLTLHLQRQPRPRGPAANDPHPPGRTAASLLAPGLALRAAANDPEGPPPPEDVYYGA